MPHIAASCTRTRAHTRTVTVTVTVTVTRSDEYGQTWWPAWGPWNLTGGGVGGSEEAAIFLASALEATGR